MRKPLQVLLRPAERARLNRLSEADEVPRGEIIRHLIDEAYRARFTADPSQAAATSEARR